jgi:rhamnopyranosyl-N-acetylglucosaminyl-diphospho-decaprenol beta-1,3/1,4-galactofuranosyltransferase
LTREDRDPRLFGVLVTFRRAAQLRSTLAALAEQTRQLDRLVVVDNSPSDESREVVRTAAPAATYLAATENLGPAGGIALGVERVLDEADDRDWIVVLDDDDPPRWPDVFATLMGFADEMIDRDPRTAAVGMSGARFDRRRGRMVRVPDDRLRGPVPVDYIAGNQFPVYSAAALRVAGGPRSDLFFGFDDLELGLRLADRGFALYASGETWWRSRAASGRLGPRPGPALRIEAPNWRRYYSLRNLVAILRDGRSVRGAVHVSLVVALGKPLASLPLRPRDAFGNLRIGARACYDGWTGRAGRRVEPD